jgi:ubiquinone/menaquinone biosynthesis C-methylase UbiE
MRRRRPAGRGAVLDVACGNGNATLAAARRFALATGIDYVPALLERARQRAQADMVELVKRFDVADDATTVLRMDYLEPIIRKPAA